MYTRPYGGMWGSIPRTLGRIHWVSPSTTYVVDGVTYSASDDNDGLSPERALRTVNKAWVNAYANAGEIIVLLPGAHSTAATIDASKSGVTMMGLPGRNRGLIQPQASLTISTASTHLITPGITTTNQEYCWITLIPITAARVFNCAQTGSAHVGLHVHHCVFDMATPAVNSSTIGIAAASSTNLQFHIHDNVVICDGAQGPLIQSRVVGGLVERNVVLHSAGTWAAVIACQTASVLGIRSNMVIETGSSASTTVVSGSTASTNGGSFIARNIFTANANPTVDNFTANTANIALNFETDPGAAAGGTQVAAIT